MPYQHFHSPPIRTLRWLLRFRKRCGYGIHSPYAFAFVTGVIYEEGAYYAYAQLDDMVKRGSLRGKDLRLLFRLANFSEARKALFLGEPVEVVEQTFRLARPRCAISHAVDGAHYDWIYLADAQSLAHAGDSLLQAASPRAVMVVRGIHRNAHSRAAWQRLQTDPRVRVTFDLYDFGILCFEPRLNKENFIINYF